MLVLLEQENAVRSDVNNDLKFYVVMPRQTTCQTHDFQCTTFASLRLYLECFFFLTWYLVLHRSMGQWQRTSLCMMQGSWSRSRAESCSWWSKETVARSWFASRPWQTLILIMMVSGWICYLTSRYSVKARQGATYLSCIDFFLHQLTNKAWSFCALYVILIILKIVILFFFYKIGNLFCWL